MIAYLNHNDPRLVAAKVSLTTQITIPGRSAVTVRQILDAPERASAFLSAACVKVFEGVDECKRVARNVDYLAYGAAVQRRAAQITQYVIKAIGERETK